MAEPARKERYTGQADRRDARQPDRRVSKFPDRRDPARLDRRVPDLKDKRRGERPGPYQYERPGQHPAEGRDKARGEAQGAQRGREAEKPGEIPKAGWGDVLKRTWRQQSKDNLSLVAAGVAFYVMLAMVPAMAAMLSIYGLVADPQQLQQQVGQLSGVLPQEAYAIIQSQLTQVAQGAGGALSLAAAVSILLSLWSASKGMKGLIQALNIAYDEQESRGFLRLTGVSLGLTLAGLIFFIVALSAVVAMPAMLGNLGLPDAVQWAVSIARWPLLALAGMVALAALYRFAPNRDQPRWQWVSPGAVVATVLWIGASLLFSWYVSNFGSYNETYGSLGAVVILLMWLYISAYVVLLGAEMNSESETQTRKDTTKGPPNPMGERGAHAADTVAREP